MDEGETTYFDRGNILVTTSRLVIADTTYLINNITSVTTKATDSGQERVTNKNQQRVAFGIGGFGLLLIMIGFFLLSYLGYDADALGSLKMSDLMSSSPVAIGLLSLGILIAGIAFLLLLSSTTTRRFVEYHLVISSPAGEKDALTSSEIEFIDAVARAINEAKTGQS